jgi:signal transduction histidine kinase
MRRFASDTLAAADIALTFRAPEATPNRPIGADIRREVLLILKESVTNVARHSGATAASVEFAAEGGRLRLCVTDNGTGFQPESVEEGNGLDSMRKRASALGGSLEITSSPGGTIITLDVDLRAARRWLPTYIRSAAERGRR